MTNIANALKNIPTFSDFDINELQKVSEIFTLRYYDCGEIFIHEGEIGKDFYILLAGVAVEFYNHSGTSENSLTKKFSKGALLGLFSMLDQGPHSVSCRAEEDITIAECSIADLQSLCDSPDPIFSKFQFAIAVQLANDIRILNQAKQASIV